MTKKLNPMERIKRSPEVPQAGPEHSSYDLRDFFWGADEDFVKNAYRLILKREVDEGGYFFYLRSLNREELERIEVLWHLIRSSEARRFKVKIKGLYRAFITRKLQKLFTFQFLQKIQELFTFRTRISMLEERMEQIENTLGPLVGMAADFRKIKSEVYKTRILVENTCPCSESSHTIGCSSPSLVEADSQNFLGFSFDYLAFVNKWHPSARLRDHFKIYLDYFLGKESILDVGCGRGEFLEILQEAGVSCHGIDIDIDMVNCCLAKGLKVQRANVLEYLVSQEDNSMEGIFCSQMLEHLSTREVFCLVELAYRKIKERGVFVVETLNPESLLTLHRYFWIDPTHKRLIHPELLKFSFETAGFSEVSYAIIPTNESNRMRVPHLPTSNGFLEQNDKFNQAIEQLNDFLFAGCDYMMVGYK